MTEDRAITAEEAAIIDEAIAAILPFSDEPEEGRTEYDRGFEDGWDTCVAFYELMMLQNNRLDFDAAWDEAHKDG